MEMGNANVGVVEESVCIWMNRPAFAEGYGHSGGIFAKEDGLNKGLYG